MCALLRQSVTAENRPWLLRSDVPIKWPCAWGKHTSGAWSLLFFPAFDTSGHTSSTSENQATSAFSRSTSKHDSRNHRWHHYCQKGRKLPASSNCIARACPIMLTPCRSSSISEQHSETSMRSRLSVLMIRTMRTFSGCGEASVASASWIASRSLGKWMGTWLGAARWM